MTKPIGSLCTRHGRRPFGRAGQPARQRGITVISLILLLLVAGLLGTMVLRLYPVYYENFKITSALRSVESEFVAQSPSIPAIRKALTARFDVESVRIIKAREVEVTRQGRGYLVRAKYDQLSPFVANINFSVSFDSTVVIGE